VCGSPASWRRSALRSLDVLDHVPVDDEELTPEDVAAIDEARADLALGNLTPWDHVRHELRHSA
jgi:hypothetical protein